MITIVRKEFGFLPPLLACEITSSGDQILFEELSRRSWVAATSKEFVPDPHRVLWDGSIDSNVQEVPHYQVTCSPLEQVDICTHHKMDMLYRVVLAGLRLFFRLVYA